MRLLILRAFSISIAPMFQEPAAWGDSEIRWLMLAFWRLR